MLTRPMGAWEAPAAALHRDKFGEGVQPANEASQHRHPWPGGGEGTAISAMRSESLALLFFIPLAPQFAISLVDRPQ